MVMALSKSVNMTNMRENRTRLSRERAAVFEDFSALPVSEAECRDKSRFVLLVDRISLITSRLLQQLSS